METPPDRKTEKSTADETTPITPPVSRIENEKALWKTRGIEDVFFQREAQVTWWTVLGGIAVAALLTQFEAVLTALKAGHWIYTLYFITTCLVIVNSWVQTSWGSLVLRWPISMPSSLIGFFQGLFLSLTALSVVHTVNWFGAIFLVIFAAVLNQLYFKKKGAWVSFPEDMIERLNRGIAIYLVFMVFAGVACLHLYLFPSAIAEIGYGIITFLASCLALLIQHIGMSKEKKRMGIA